ncbi:hypothetical protein LC574_16080 [Nostoc sp. CHAB 5715]|nr:hypothetical protein [Nostoc sp. CHAB 5715]
MGSAMPLRVDVPHVNKNRYKSWNLDELKSYIYFSSVFIAKYEIVPSGE